MNFIIEKLRTLTTLGFSVEEIDSGIILDFPDGKNWIQVNEAGGYINVGCALLSGTDIRNRSTTFELIAKINSRVLGSRLCLLETDIWLMHDAYPFVQTIDDFMLIMRQILWNKKQLFPLLLSAQEQLSLPSDSEIDFAFMPRNVM